MAWYMGTGVVCIWQNSRFLAGCIVQKCFAASDTDCSEGLPLATFGSSFGSYPTTVLAMHRYARRHLHIQMCRQ